MPLNSVDEPAGTHGETFNPIFPTRNDKGETVVVQVTTEALNKLGYTSDYLEACESCRAELESIASLKYDLQGGGNVVIGEGDV